MKLLHLVIKLLPTIAKISIYSAMAHEKKDPSYLVIAIPYGVELIMELWKYVSENQE